MTLQEASLWGNFVPTPDVNLLHNLVAPASGHNFEQAICDLIDNCIDAGSTNTRIMLMEDQGGKLNSLTRLLIVDNGSGMNAEILKKSLTYCAGSVHSPTDMGKFSIGGTTACCTISQARTVITKTENGQLLVGQQNFSDVVSSTLLRPPSPEEVKTFQDMCGDHGTIIICEGLKSEVLPYARTEALMKHLLSHFGMIYHNLIGENHQLSVWLRDKYNKVEPKDPTYINYDLRKVTSHETKEICFRGQTITLRMSILQGLSTDEKAYESQGLYFSRNGRIIQYNKAIAGLWRNNPQSNLARIEVLYPSALDKDFNTTATKNGLSISSEVIDVLKPHISRWKALTSSKYRSNVKPNEELIQNENLFQDRLLKNSHQHLPKSKKETTNQKIEGKERTQRGNAGTNPKGDGTGSKRNSYLKDKELPQFEHVNSPRIPTPWFTEIQDDLSIKVFINDANPLIQKLYMQGSEQLREFILMIANSIAVSKYEYSDTQAEKHIDNFELTFMTRLGEFFKTMN
jgi:hypothetical protein